LDYGKDDVRSGGAALKKRRHAVQNHGGNPQDQNYGKNFQKGDVRRHNRRAIQRAPEPRNPKLGNVFLEPRAKKVL